MLIAGDRVVVVVRPIASGRGVALDFGRDAGDRALVVMNTGPTPPDTARRTA